MRRVLLINNDISKKKIHTELGEKTRRIRIVAIRVRLLVSPISLASFHILDAISPSWRLTCLIISPFLPMNKMEGVSQNRARM